MLKHLSICALAGLALSACTASIDPSTVTSVVHETSDTSFHTDVLSAANPVFVDFYATWCQPCKKMDPIIEELASQYSGRVEFVRIDVDKNKKIAAQLGVEGLPPLQYSRMAP